MNKKKIIDINRNIPTKLRTDPADDIIQFSLRYLLKSGEFSRKQYEKHHGVKEFEIICGKLEHWADSGLQNPIDTMIRDGVLDILGKGRRERASFRPDASPKIDPEMRDLILCRLKLDNSIRVGVYFDKGNNKMYIRWIAPHHD